MSKLITIINSKFSDKSGLGQWYKDRLHECLTCEYNSENKQEMTVKERAKVLANFGEPTCLACGCEIAAKASVETEDCGMVKLGKDSKWVTLGISREGDFVVVNNSNKKVSMIKSGPVNYTLMYGEIVKGSDSEIGLKISKKKLKIIKISKHSTCGCTIPEAAFDDKGEITYKIKYDTQRIGYFEKTVSLSIFEENGKSNKLFFTIKGEVKP